MALAPGRIEQGSALGAIGAAAGMPARREPESVVLDVILVSLKVLGDRTLLALYHLVPLLALSTVGAFAWTVSENPSDRQLIALGIFAVFALFLVWMTRKR